MFLPPGRLILFVFFIVDGENVFHVDVLFRETFGFFAIDEDWFKYLVNLFIFLMSRIEYESGS